MASPLRLRVVGGGIMIVGGAWVALLLFHVVTIGSSLLPYGLRMGIGGGLGLLLVGIGVKAFQAADTLTPRQVPGEAGGVLRSSR